MRASLITRGRRVWLAAGGLAGVWLVALAVQDRIESSVLWAAVDVVAHGAAAALCTVWLWPAFGARPVLCALLAGTLIDLDHAVAAQSLDPHRMMSLDARPITHSLMGAAVLGLLAGAVIGIVEGYAVAIGVLAHLLGDAVEPAGLPLLAPFVADTQIRLPPWVVPVGLGLSVCASAWLARRARPGRR